MNGIHDVALHARPVIQAIGPIEAFRLACVTGMKGVQDSASAANWRNNAMSVQKNEGA